MILEIHNFIELHVMFYLIWNIIFTDFNWSIAVYSLNVGEKCPVEFFIVTVCYFLEVWYNIRFWVFAWRIYCVIYICIDANKLLTFTWCNSGIEGKKILFYPRKRHVCRYMIYSATTVDLYFQSYLTVLIDRYQF